MHLLLLGALAAQPDTAQAARDNADAPTLRTHIAESRKLSTLDALLRTATLNAHLCEALYATNDTAAIKRAAQAGAAALAGLGALASATRSQTWRAN